MFYDNFIFLFLFVLVWMCELFKLWSWLGRMLKVWVVLGCLVDINYCCWLEVEFLS